jgi:hypothetical protein
VSVALVGDTNLAAAILAQLAAHQFLSRVDGLRGVAGYVFLPRDAAMRSAVNELRAFYERHPLILIRAVRSGHVVRQRSLGDVLLDPRDPISSSDDIDRRNGEAAPGA